MPATNPLSIEHDSSHPHPWIRALETFNIPFLCYGVDGRRTYVSAAGEALLRVEPIGVTLGAQADEAALDASWSNHSLSIGQFALIRELPGWSDGIVLAIHIARPAGGLCSAVVVIRLSAGACQGHRPLNGLTRREADVARLVAAGLATKVIAFRLGISPHTARHHTERVFEKLGVRSRAGVAALFAGWLGTSSHTPDAISRRVESSSRRPS
jgi:DNA-binding CsgD family transcriptional regulator